MKLEINSNGSKPTRIRDRKVILPFFHVIIPLKIHVR